MLPKKNRISRKDFPSYNVKGFRLFSPLFSAVVYKNTPNKAQESRVSVVVSKKTAKLAVDRNRLRRRFYDLVAPFLKGNDTPFVLVVYPKKEAKDTKNIELKNEVEKVFKQGKVA